MILKRCNKPGCVEHIPRSQVPPYCEAHRRQQYRAYDKTRPAHIVAFYNSVKWKKLRASVLAEAHYMCEPCKAQGELTPADTVHHIIEVKDDWEKRLERSNTMAICRTCHNLIHEKGL